MGVDAAYTKQCVEFLGGGYFFHFAMRSIFLGPILFILSSTQLFPGWVLLIPSTTQKFRVIDTAYTTKYAAF